jgi:hypoxanthine phosphoribosyltransferase
MALQPKLLLSEEAIAARVAEVASEISRDYAGRSLHIIGVLKGAFIFLADLTRQLTVPHHVHFVSVASYGKSTVSAGVRLLLDVDQDIQNQHVLIVDDILDTGATLAYLIEMFAARDPASIKSCVMVRKAKPGAAPALVDYVGFQIPDEWVVGYGLDYADQLRTLPYIATVDPTAE